MAKKTKNETTTGTTQTVQPTQAQKPTKLTEDQEIQNLNGVISWLQNFDRVPGSHATSWGQVIEALVVVHNSLVLKKNETPVLQQPAESVQVN